MKNPKFSIIIPVFNAENYLKETLDSIRIQIYGNFEVIIVDDASTDNSLNIANSYAGYDKRFHVYSYYHSGFSTTRNRGISHVTGDYIIFVDADDLISPDLLSVVADEVIHSAELPEVIKFSAKCIPLKDDETPPTNLPIPVFSGITGPEALEIFLDINAYFSTVWGYAIQTDFLRKYNIKFPAGKFREDFRFVLEMLLRAHSVSSTYYVGYYNMEREESIRNNNEASHHYRVALDLLSHYDNINALLMIYPLPEKLDKKFRAYLKDTLLERLEHLTPSHREQYEHFLTLRHLL